MNETGITAEEAEASSDSLVYLIDDYPDDLLLLRRLCESINLKVQTFASPMDFLGKADLKVHGCIVVDLLMPQMSGLELHDEIRRRGSTLPIIVVTGHADAATCRSAFKSGVFDFVEKSFNPHELVQVIRRAVRESEKTERETQVRANSIASLDKLSPREGEVADLLSKGRTLKEIGQVLGISVQTASKHRGRLFEKLQVNNEVDLFKLLLAADPDRASNEPAEFDSADADS